VIEKDEQIQKFFELCESSSFSHREELLRGVNAGEYLFESYSNSEVPTQQLLGTYSFRANHLAEKQGKHAQTLRNDTLKFVEELEKFPNDKVKFWHFSINESSQYTVFENVNSQKILGCIRNVDKRKVSESEWEKLWNE
jgi:hypothetical protein